MFVRGIPCAPGVAIVNIVLSQFADLQLIPDRRAPDIDMEETAFQTAVFTAKKELRASSERMRKFDIQKPYLVIPMKRTANANLMQQFH